MIDLHTHSRFSDGSDTPAELVRLAAEAGLDAIALTDHDTLSGLPAARAEAERVGVQLVPGVELSCHTDSRFVHILGLFVREGDPTFEGRLEQQRVLRDGRNAEMVEQLTSIGLPISMDDVLAEAGDHSVGRPHIAAAMMKRGYVDSIDEAFRRYLSEGKPGYVSRRSLAAAEGISWIIDAGGIAIWAHPFTPLRHADTDLRPDLEQLVDAGLGGLESWYSRYHDVNRQRLVRLARKWDIVPTGGSDYHGTYKPDLRIGQGEGDLAVPNSVLTELIGRQLR